MGERINELAAENIELRSRLNSSTLVIRQLSECEFDEAILGSPRIEQVLLAAKRIIEMEKA